MTISQVELMLIGKWIRKDNNHKYAFLSDNGIGQQSNLIIFVSLDKAYNLSYSIAERGGEFYIYFVGINVFHITYLSREKILMKDLDNREIEFEKVND